MATSKKSIIGKVPPPYKHQKAAFDASKDSKYFAFLMEMGTGKTRPIIETAVHLHKKGKIEALVVMAPNGVHTNWVLNELPKWCQADYRAAIWESTPTLKRKAVLDAIVARPYDGIRVLCVNYESTRSLKFKVYLRKFLKSFKTIMVLDESTRIKNASSKQSKFIVGLRNLPVYRRIMSGLVTPNSPFDIYKQFEFLSPDILGFGSFFAFKAHFSEVEDNQYLLDHIKKQNVDRKAAALAIGSTKHYSTRVPQMVKKDDEGQPIYKNLPELAELIAPHSFRVLKSECLDLPAKIYRDPVIIPLTPKQRKAYDTVKEELIAEFEEGDITMPRAITKMIRLQQITGGFWKLDEDKFAKPIDGKFPKLEYMLENIEDTKGKTAIWTHFQHENELITESLKDIYGGGSVVQYYGKVSKEARISAVDLFSDVVRDTKGKAHFKESKVKFWVGEPHSGGIGLTLVTAEEVHYYSNSFNLEDRLQSEDRHHRSGLTHAVGYNDYIVAASIDQIIVQSLRGKKDIASAIMKDGPSAWI